MQTAPPFDPYAVLQVVPTADVEVIHAAFRALALKYHPDRDATRRAATKMEDLNRAYAVLRDERSRAAYDRSRRAMLATTVVASAMRPAAQPAAASVASSATPGAAGSAGSVLPFGRYAGWTLRDLARHDPDYVLWLSRHSSGIRYRTEIYSILRTMGVSTAA
jgi:curved DNA-binding protein CbpA